ncbi:M1 family metallopeptidase [Candidatus Binatia bacterium]|nr:M1 family metallopeptidase [Candidatus Binatia bacterium]
MVARGKRQPHGGRRRFWPWVATAVLVAAAPAGMVLAAAPARLANYTIAAAYNPADHSIAGTAVIRWRNSAQQPAPDLQFHLYLNAFANNRSTLIRGLGHLADQWLAQKPEPWGYQSVSRLRVDGVDVTDRLEYVQPQDGNIDDRTVLRVPLAHPVPPGTEAAVEVEFTAKLPRVALRTGYAGPFAMAAQWFPKLGVFGAGGWACHQYHATTEFFADFGRYDVSLAVPDDGVVGATGSLVDEQRHGDGTKTLRFVADPVHDFAWAIDSRFRVVTEAVDGIRVRLLLQPLHAAQQERYLGAVRAAVAHYKARIGAYPYAELTVVDPGPGAQGAGGMEYPTLITVGTTWGMPAGLRFPEFVTVHEFGHQYWFGLVASNEAAEAWLDEGVNSYVEGRIMDAVYGPGSYVNLAGWQMDSVAFRRLQYLVAPGQDPITRPAWQVLDISSYRATTYAKTALALETLGRRVGADRLEAALAGYFERWRFGHPDGNDLRAELRAALGDEVEDFIAQVFDGTGLLDFAVTRVNADVVPRFAGYEIEGGKVSRLVLPDGENSDVRYRNEVVVERLGGVVLPVVVEATFDDGSTTRVTWNGEDRWQRFLFTGAQPIAWAVVDPDHDLSLDANWLNNSRMRRPGTRGLSRLVGAWTDAFQALIQLLTWM